MNKVLICSFTRAECEREQNNTTYDSFHFFQILFPANSEYDPLNFVEWNEFEKKIAQKYGV